MLTQPSPAVPLRRRRRQAALTPIDGVSADWLDSMILKGRMVIGCSAEEHALACAQIVLERAARPGR